MLSIYVKPEFVLSPTHLHVLSRVLNGRKLNFALDRVTLVVIRINKREFLYF